MYSSGEGHLFVSGLPKTEQDALQQKLGVKKVVTTNTNYQDFHLPKGCHEGAFLVDFVVHHMSSYGHALISGFPVGQDIYLSFR